MRPGAAAIVMGMLLSTHASAAPNRGELTLIFGPKADDMVRVHADGSFEVVSPEQTSFRGCGGVCPRHVERFAVAGETIVQGSRVLLSRTRGGIVDLWGLGRVAIDEDGGLIAEGHRRALDASGRIAHLDGEPDVMVIGAVTPQLRRRAMLVVVFVELELVIAAIAQTSD